MIWHVIYLSNHFGVNTSFWNKEEHEKSFQNELQVATLRNARSAQKKKV